LDGENAIGKRKPASEDGPNGDWIDATILFRQEWNGKPTVGSVRSATGFPLLLHKPLTVLTIRAETLSMNFRSGVKSGA
jgi:hypothetical protein